MSKQMSGRTALVTGASGGIGRAVSLRLAQDGVRCLLAGRDSGKLEALATEIEGAGGPKPVLQTGDLRDGDACDALAAAARDLGRVDILVGCAGATRAGSFLELDDAAWLDGFALKFHAMVRMTRLLWPLLKDAHGTVVYVAGGAARYPSADFAIGGAVNAALANFAKAMSGLGLKDDVNVNAIHPAMTLTGRLETLIEAKAKAASLSYEDMLSRDIAASGARRLVAPQDIADLVAFLCAPSSRHINGVAIAVDGGGSKALY